MPPTDQHTRQALLQQLESLHAAGVRQLPAAEPLKISRSHQPEETTDRRVASLNEEVDSDNAPSSQPHTSSVEGQAAGLFDDTQPQTVSRAATLDVLEQEVSACTLCDELASTRNKTVFGAGNPRARLCFLGEAPGADEDRTGIPFVGRAGQLLDKIIEACTLTRDEVYILNILKCRPPGNRNPKPDESDNCRRFLIRQLELIEPEFICCLGSVAAQNLLDTTQTIGRLRGRTHAYRGTPVVCTYHPAYLLRNPSAKKETWDDMKMLMRKLGVEL